MSKKPSSIEPVRCPWAKGEHYIEYRNGPERKHDWHSGWVPEAVELLFGSEAVGAKP